MLNSEDMVRIERVYKDLENAKNAHAAIEAEMNMIKKQAKELFVKHNIKGFSEIKKLVEKAESLSQEIEEEEKRALEYIEKINEVKEEKEKILVE